uniref:uncharacterized protein LOC117258213 isoform X3 n=1 Tax=Epinephelus lanceolatus TaxID=310571 RepID=UPI0014465452|nr:uncharacterized protein LOC117258213 isoform X3 [Epinephelus lanceolatus]
MDTESPLLSFIKSSLPKLRDPEPLLEHLQDLGVEDLQDLSYLQESDLLSVLRPIEVRKLLSLLKKTSQQDVLDSPPRNQSNEQFSRASTSASPVTQSDKMPLSGNSTLAAENFMLSADQTIVNSHISIFSDALKLMFGLLPYEHILPSSPSINFGVLTEVPLQDKSRQGIKSGAERHQKTTCSQSKGSHTDNQNCRLRVEGIRSAHKLWILCPSYRLFHSLYPVRFHVSYLLCSFVINVVDV